MMDVTPQLTAGAQLIEAYGPEGFRIGGKQYATSVLVSPTVTQPLSLTLDTLNAASLLPLLDAQTEVLLIGTGMRHEMVAPALRMALKARGIASDSMDTGAAARTFNILLSEGRKVSAALILNP